MSFFYALLAVTGWVWLVIVGGFVFMKLRRRRSAASGFDVQLPETTDAKQH